MPEPSPTSGAILRVVGVVSFAVLTLGTAIVDLGWPVPVKVPVGAELEQLIERTEKARWIDGTKPELFAEAAGMRSRVRRDVLPSWSMVLWGRLGVTNEAVVAGPRGDLFLKRYLDLPEDVDGPQVIQRLKDLDAYLHWLRAGGREVTLVLVPNRSMAQWRQLPAGERSHRDLHAITAQLMAAAGHATLDLLPTLDGGHDHPFDLYPRTDTHWTWHGARLAAQAISDRLGLLATEDARLGEIVSLGMLPDSGDLTEQLGLDVPRMLADSDYRAWMTALAGLGEQERLEAQDESGRPIGAPGSPPDVTAVPLFGTSYSAWPGFRGFIRHFSGGRMDVLARPGGGLTEALESIVSLGLPLPPRIAVEISTAELFRPLGHPREPLERVIGFLPRPGTRPAPAGWPTWEVGPEGRVLNDLAIEGRFSATLGITGAPTQVKWNWSPWPLSPSMATGRQETWWPATTPLMASTVQRSRIHCVPESGWAGRARLNLSPVAGASLVRREPQEQGAGVWALGQLDRASRSYLVNVTADASAVWHLESRRGRILRAEGRSVWFGLGALPLVGGEEIRLSAEGALPETAPRIRVWELGP